MYKEHELSNILKILSKLQITLNMNGGPQNDADCFEQMLEIQDKILRSFGLPIIPDYERILYFDNPPTDAEISNRILKLYQSAVEYLSSNTKSNLQILKEAQKLKLNAFSVLPELSIPTHTYTIFVYEEILLKQKDIPENVLHELKLVTKSNILSTLGKLEQNLIHDENDIIEILENIGVKYIRQFHFHFKNSTTYHQQLYIMNDLLNKAITFALEAHKEQIDKTGAPYIGHIMRVMQAGNTVDEKITGALHDLVEDTDWTFEQLETEFPKHIVDAIRCLTKTSDEEPYDEFIKRVMTNPLAIKVKINDLSDNMDVRRLQLITDEDIVRLKKYHKAYRILIAL